MERSGILSAYAVRSGRKVGEWVDRSGVDMTKTKHCFPSAIVLRLFLRTGLCCFEEHHLTLNIFQTQNKNFYYIRV